MYLRHQGQVIFIAVCPLNIREYPYSLEIFMFTEKLVANCGILRRIQRTGGINQTAADADIFSRRTQDIILQNRQFVNIFKGFIAYLGLSAEYSEPRTWCVAQHSVRFFKAGLTLEASLGITEMF